MAITIGTIRLATPVLLAPMAGYTDLPFRLSVRELGGLGLAFTELLNPRSFLLGKGKQIANLLATSLNDTPLGYQIYGHEPEIMADGARWLQQHGAALIDINSGCPQKKIVKRGAGAGLMRSREAALSVVRSVVEAVSVPVTVKIRLGWERSGIPASEFARDFEQAGIAAITVHGRTCGQAFAGTADWAGIRAVVEAVKSIPVIGNGDINSPAEARMMREETGCAGVMIGRQTLRNPWIIRDVAAELDNQPIPTAPETAERVNFMRRHFERMVLCHEGDLSAIIFRRWIPQYARQLRMNRDVMLRIIKLDSVEEMRKAIQGL